VPQPIETPGTTVSLVGGIIRIRSKGIESTPETLDATFDAVSRLTDREPHPVLADVRSGLSWETATWSTFITRAASAFTAIAVVTNAEGGPDPGPFQDTIEKMLMPFRMFTDEAGALEFLEAFRAT
jgi:hypothetical protein